MSRFPRAQLLSVVKNQSVEHIQTLIDAGAKTIAFGKVQEAEEKLPLLQFSGSIHFIGRLQKNKAKKAIRIFDCIQSVDTLSLAIKISDECEKIGKKMPVLLQVNISKDPNKTGFLPEEIFQGAERIRQISGLQICGLMTIGRLGISEDMRREEYKKMRQFFEKINSHFGGDFTELSMGMSNDYQIALKEGATMVRVGSALFL